MLVFSSTHNTNSPRWYRRVQVEPGDVQGFRLELAVVAVQPWRAAVGLEVVGVEDAVDGAAAHVPVVGVLEDLDGQVLQRPVRERQAQLGRLGGRQPDDPVAGLPGEKTARGR